MLTDRCIRVDHTVIAHLRILANVSMRIQGNAITDHRMVIHHSERHDDNILAQLHILADMRLIADTLREFELRRKKLQELCKSGTRLLHIKRRLRELPSPLRQHDSSRLTGLRFLNVRFHGEGQVTCTCPLDIVETVDFDGRITYHPATKEIGDFLQRFLHDSSPI